MTKIIIKNDDGSILSEYDTDEVLWQVLEKNDIAEDMTKEQWLEFVDDNSSEFADEVSSVGREFVSNYEPTE